MPKLTINGIDDLKARVGQELGTSDWIDVTQDEINAFADATGDHQWIHVDPERAAQTPFGGTIAHGYFVLSLLPQLMFERLLDVRGLSAMLNYGADKLRFPDVAKVGCELTMSATLESLTPRPPGELATFAVEFRASGSAKPCCVAQILLLLLP